MLTSTSVPCPVHTHTLRHTHTHTHTHTTAKLADPGAFEQDDETGVVFDDMVDDYEDEDEAIDAVSVNYNYRVLPSLMCITKIHSFCILPTCAIELLVYNLYPSLADISHLMNH